MLATIQIHTDGQWRTAATYESTNEAELAKGISGGGRLLYDVGYAAQYFGSNPYHAISARYPVNFEFITTKHWPSFLVDLLPGGAGRRFFYERLGIPQAPTGDWPLLLAGASHPPGHLRIKESLKDVALDSHPGFARQELLDRQDEFIEYAHQHGAPVAGSSDVQGDSPKFLLVEDKNGRWHAEGAISESSVKQHWLVKFPRGKQQSDRDILCNEAAYYCVASKLGLRTYRPLIHESNTLFVPRFDRAFNNDKIVRYGQESLYSLTGISEFGKAMKNEQLCEVIARYSNDPQRELIEFICRDVINVAMGNTDNHGRNTAMQYLPDGTAQLTPLFDFAPMILDDAGISRVCRWENADNGGYSDWAKVIADVALLNIGISEVQLRAGLQKFSQCFIHIPAILRECAVDNNLITRISGRMDHVIRSLESL